MAVLIMDEQADAIKTAYFFLYYYFMLYNYFGQEIPDRQYMKKLKIKLIEVTMGKNCKFCNLGFEFYRLIIPIVNFMIQKSII